MMGTFAEMFHEQNPQAFHSQDGIHVLSYALIMLQTNLHNPNVKRRDRMSIKQFVSSLRGIDDGHDIAAHSLEVSSHML